MKLDSDEAALECATGSAIASKRRRVLIGAFRVGLTGVVMNLHANMEKHLAPMSWG
ncbi:hypothetical protein X742_22865 [Mesorhizobium sp. LNHC232B00]|nr:hypothetical protein X742_22865 [Mesorhizobium sp. LNHC232B00]